MALFSFANISFGSSNRTLGANQTTLGTGYSYDIYRYPEDLGSANKGHYMMFHINQQKKTQFSNGAIKRGNTLPTVLQNAKDFGVPSTFLSVSSLINNVSSSVNLDFTRKINRVTDTVALYMPDTLAFTHSQQYSDLSLTGMLAAGISTVDSIKEIKDSLAKNDLRSLAGTLSPALAILVRNEPILKAAFTAISGKVVNPMLEMIYTSPNFREFRFDFFFYPRSEKEAEEVQKIINRFHYHQAPEIENVGSGFFLIPPSEFDILFYYNGSINPNIPKISTCVLQSIDVDYAPNGFSAYEVQGEPTPRIGRTGMPVGIRMSLNFKETEIMTKNNFKTSKDNAVETSSGATAFPVAAPRNIPEVETP
jgi:hypothetical protein